MKRKSSPTPRGRPAAEASFTATEAQNNFGQVLDRASADGVVYITKHLRPTAVVLSVDRYEALTRADRPDLDALALEYDRMMERMQSPKAAAGYDALFTASPEALGEAAARGARRTGKAASGGAKRSSSAGGAAIP